MKHFFNYLAKLFQGSVGKLFFVANYIICLVIFDWNKFFNYLDAPTRFNCHLEPYSRGGGGIDFSIYGFYGSSYGFGMLEHLFAPIIYFFLFLFVALLLILLYPSMAMTQIIRNLLKTVFPLWCIETTEIIYLPIFVVLNSFYWLFLGDMIERAHTAYLEIKPAYKVLSIFPDSH